MYKNQSYKLSYSVRILQSWLVPMVAMGSLMACSAMAAPEGASVELGDVTIHDEGSSNVIVEQFSERALINWKSFDTKKDESISFKQPGASSIAVNVIHSGSPTKFMGSLDANGQVVLINTSGIVFGKSSRVDVAGLVATTLDLDRETFSEKGGPLHFKAGEKFDAEASIVNRGVMTVAEAGLVGFVSPVVQNNGVIEATLGTVHLGSGDEFTVDMAGDGLVSLSLNQDLKKQLVSNAGEINAKGGKIYLTAAVGKEIVDDVINMKGVANAEIVEMRQGVIHIEFKKDEKEPVKDEGEVAVPPVAEPPAVEEPPVVEEPAPVAEEPTDEEEIELVSDEPTEVTDGGLPSTPSQSVVSSKPVVLRWQGFGFKIKDALMSLSAPDYQSRFVKNDLVEMRKKDGQ
jgi:filamentous hemagglutinin family protein